MAGSSRSSSAKLVSTITRLEGSRWRSSRIAPTPSRRGITRSIRITSGRSRSAARTASAPSPASPTTSMPSCSSRKVRSPSRTTAWSPTPSPRIAPATPRLESHGGPRRRRGPDLEPAAQALGPLLHRGQAKALRAHLGVGGVEADAVVGDLQHEGAVGGGEAHRDPLGARVAQGVLNRLLGDPQDLAVPAAVAGADAIAEIEVDVDAVEPAQDLDVLAERAVEAVPLEVRRAQLEDQRAKLVEGLAGELLGTGDLLAGGRLVPVEQGAGRLRGQHHGEQLLADDVVELEGDAVAL